MQSNPPRKQCADRNTDRNNGDMPHEDVCRLEVRTMWFEHTRTGRGAQHAGDQSGGGGVDSESAARHQPAQQSSWDGVNKTGKQTCDADRQATESCYEPSCVTQNKLYTYVGNVGHTVIALFCTVEHVVGGPGTELGAPAFVIAAFVPLVPFAPFGLKVPSPE
jgi:hypothetical protein